MASIDESETGPDTGYHGFPQRQRGAGTGHMYGHVQRDRARERTNAISANPRRFRRPTVR